MPIEKVPGAEVEKPSQWLQDIETAAITSSLNIFEKLYPSERYHRASNLVAYLSTELMQVLNQQSFHIPQFDDALHQAVKEHIKSQWMRLILAGGLRSDQKEAFTFGMSDYTQGNILFSNTDFAGSMMQQIASKVTRTT